MRYAYVCTDGLENPEVLLDLKSRLDHQHIRMVTTTKPWQQIYHPCPFLYFRTPYLRYDIEGQILDFHIQNPQFPLIQTASREIVSVSPHSTETNTFVLKSGTYYMMPSIKPLPILIGTHCRSTYFQLTINSLFNSFSLEPEQKIYIIASQPDAETLEIINRTLRIHSNVEAVISTENLKYSFANFGSKFFNLEKFIHFEDDGIIPDSVKYLLPFWTRQLAYRATTADIVAMRVYEGNWASEMYLCGMLNAKPLYKFDDSLWHYFLKRDAEKYTLPLGGLGFVIDCPRMYKNFDPIMHASSDRIIFQQSKSLCMLNLPIYHIGANQKMDYPDYAMKKKSAEVARYQTGRNMRTGEERQIDLAVDWAAR